MLKLIFSQHTESTHAHSLSSGAQNPLKTTNPNQASVANRQGRSGFTLIEILVVAAIISLLSSIVLSSVNEARSSARDAQRQTDLNQVRTGMQLFRDRNGRFPTSWTELEGSDVMNQVPTDPTGGNHYGFTPDSSSADICLAACTEEAAPAFSASSTCSDANAGIGAGSYNVDSSSRVNDDGTCSSGNPYYITL